MSKGNTISKNRSYTYDSSNGLLSSRTMPGGKTVQYTYDAYGNTTGVDFESGTIAWSLTGYNGRRTTSQIVLDNNSIPFEKTILLDQYGHLDSLKTIQPSQWGPLTHQLEKYTFDPIRGNLTQKQGQYDMYPVSYTYDNADRLRTATENNSQRMAVTYSVNGNILSKTGIGSYTYGSTSHPHAVTEVDNTNGNIGYNEQQVYYNSWGKISSAWSYDPNDFYYYSVEYGPDLQRVWTQLDKTYNIEYSKYYWDDYEEKTTGSLTTRYWYINGPDGLIGIYIEEQTPSGTVSIPTVAATDHLGSIEGLFGNNNYCYFAARYDEWGDRDVMLLYGLSHGFDRGYTGHEHIDGLGLINMNGRMYDPLLGRFLSPDPFVQSPGNPQNYNRYSYCLNNPLKYTDPSGEKISWLWGLAVGLNLIPIESVMAFVTVASTDAITSGAIGLIDGGVDEATNRAANSIKIATGLFESDETDCNELDQFGRSYIRSVWCSPISLFGYAYCTNANYYDRIDVDTYYGATVLRSNCVSGSVTFGHYIMINPKYTDVEYMGRLIHEYGHFMQARGWGGFSALSGGIFSLFGAFNKGSFWGINHEQLWIERDASIRGAEHLSEEFEKKENKLILLKEHYNKNYPQDYYDLRMLHNMFIPFSVGFGIYNIIVPN